jgi:hypothetical protein
MRVSFIRSIYNNVIKIITVLYKEAGALKIGESLKKLKLTEDWLAVIIGFILIALVWLGIIRWVPW